MQRDGRGRQAVLCTAFGPVGRDLPQTSGAGEFAALATAAQFAQAPCEVAADYATAVKAAADSMWHRDGRRMLSGILRTARSYPGWALISAVRKVAAHTNLAELSGDALLDGTANDLADQAAKQGVLLHPPVCANTVATFEAQWHIARKVIVLAGKLLSEWPRAAAAGRRERRTPEPAAAQAPAAAPSQRRWLDNGHTWVCHGVGWRCMKCLRGLRNAERHAHRATPPCPGRCEFLVALIEGPQDQHSHDLVIFDGVDSFDDWVVACSRCGYYGSTASAFRRMGANPCSGAMGRGAEYRWRRLCRGVHPTSERRLGAGGALRAAGQAP